MNIGESSTHWRSWPASASPRPQWPPELSTSSRSTWPRPSTTKSTASTTRWRRELGDGPTESGE